MDTIKILIFNWRDIRNPEAGGAEVFTHENAKRWVKAGNEVTLFTSEFPGCRREEVLDGVRIFRRGGRYTVYWRAKSYYGKFLKGRFDVVVDEINTRPFLTTGFVGEPVVALIHQLAREYWLHETPLPLSFLGYYLLEPRWLRNYIGVPTITVSESTRRDLVELGFKRVYVVPEGIGFQPCEKMPEKEVKPTCIYVGRLTKAKRPHHVIDAFKLVKREFSDARLWVLGDGYMRRELEKDAPEGVRFFGHVPEGEKIRLMKRAWVLVNPSVREGFGLNVIEANACGTPCVAYHVPGLMDLIKDGETGILVKSGGIRSLAGAIKTILREDALRYELGENALGHSRQFSWDKTARDIIEIVRNVINQ